MKNWWVNHKQTHRAEIEGGYIWSPKTNANGGRNQTYINLSLAKPGDKVYSFADAQIKAVGIITDVATEQAKPEEFGKAGETWADSGWLVGVSWVIAKKPLRVKSVAHMLAPYLPEKYSPIRQSGDGNQSCYLAEISIELSNILTELLEERGNRFSEMLGALTDETIESALEELINDDLTLESTEKSQLTKARIGQGRFRLNVEIIESGCRLTGVESPELLIASHIKPWRVSDNQERLDGNNGFLLAPHVDKLFDRGFISFTDKGDVLISGAVGKSAIEAWQLPKKAIGKEFNLRQKQYLQYHRTKVFKGETN